jgi:hypothetical protein
MTLFTYCDESNLGTTVVNDHDHTINLDRSHFHRQGCCPSIIHRTPSTLLDELMEDPSSFSLVLNLNTKLCILSYLAKYSVSLSFTLPSPPWET